MFFQKYVFPKILFFQKYVFQKVKVPKTTYKHLVNLTLAENFPMNENLNIDILIGSDIYWNFFKGNVINANEGPVAM